MPIFRLGEDPEAFPPVEWTHSSGLLAVGGDLSPQRLLAAYRRGIFPWYSAGQPILWHAPDPRFVLVPDQIHIPRSLKKQLNRGIYRVTLDTAFAQVIDACAQTPREGQKGTWITQQMRDAYLELHRLGFAHSAEAWNEGQLRGGLYGISLGSIFFGESMFAHAPDASKVAFVTLVSQLQQWGFTLIDCQQETEHLERFGAQSWPRANFQEALKAGLLARTRQGKWELGAP